MPKQTRETALPKPPPAPINWKKVAKSGKVWDFVQGEDGDFTGKPEVYRGRLKTEARRVGVDFNWVLVEKNGGVVLKVLAFEMEGSGKGDKPAADAGSIAGNGESNERRDGESRSDDQRLAA